ncbi:major facilitator superfamily domain-containing protein [Xylariaceae sp. FL0804]|nr:major facilitator superfamily domain-containing protein [Xylariaceae sp. FL0804]
MNPPSSSSSSSDRGPSPPPRSGAHSASSQRTHDGPAPPRLGSGFARVDTQLGNDGIGEASPLLSPQGGAEQDFLIGGEGRTAESPAHDDFQTTKSIWYLLGLAISIGGLQVAWAVELSNGTPYLVDLGLSKDLMALVWVAGPITGTLVQPYVGMLSDNCRVSWGKRKPFMLGGAAATTLSLLFLAWIREILGGFLGWFGADPASDGVRTTIIVVAVIWIYVLDVAVNTVQASIRAFIVDCAPSHQQEAANSMASRIVGLGNIIGYIAGGINLPKYVWFFGETQFKDLCAIASILLCSTILFSVIFIRERNPRVDGRLAQDRPGLASFFVKIFASMKRLPPQVRRVCVVQFFAWVGFFPMLFYTSSYIGGIYSEPYLEANPHMTKEELHELHERAIRVGTHALLIFAITSLATNVLLPFFIDPTYDNNPVAKSNAPGEMPGITDDDLSGAQKWLRRLVIPGFTLRRAWMYSHILFAVSMFCTVLVRTVEAATVLIGLVGITWAITLWAPWAIISAEISRRDVMHRTQRQRMRPVVLERASAGDPDGHDPTAAAILSEERRLRDPADDDEPDQAGVILGIHNMAIASPQMIATLGSSVIFALFQKPEGTPGDRSYGVVLASGGAFVLVAAWLVHQLREDTSSLSSSSDGIPPDAYAAEEGNAAVVGPESPSGSKRRSVDTPRASMDRATLARNSSFGAGLEY